MIASYRLLSLVIVASSCLLLNSVALNQQQRQQQYDSFQLLFSNSPAEFESVPIWFSRSLPSEIRGSMVHNGLGWFEFPSRSFTHPFDGLAKLTKVEFVPGSNEARFSTRFLRTKVYSESVQMSNIAPYLFFDSVQPRFNAVHRLLALVHGLDNMNVNVMRVPVAINSTGYSYLALNDISRSYSFSLESLRTLRMIEADDVNVGQHLVLHRAFSFLSRLSSAHPLPEYGTANHITFVTSLLPITGHCSVSIVRIRSESSRELLHTWRTSTASYMHSFAATQHYILLFLNPLFINIGRILATADPVRSLDWRPEEQMRILWLRLDTGASGEAAVTDGHFLMHHINAYEEPLSNGTVVIADATAYPDLSFLQGITRSSLRNRTERNAIEVNNSLRRYRVSLLTGIAEALPLPVKQKQLLRLEMPIINELYRFRPYCFVYGVLLKSDAKEFSRVSLVKKSMCNASHDKVWYREHHYPSEPAFYAARKSTAAAAAAVAEDDGYLVSLVMNGLTNITYVGVFNASSMQLMDSAKLPTWLPYRLHGKAFT